MEGLVAATIPLSLQSSNDYPRACVSIWVGIQILHIEPFAIEVLINKSLNEEFM